MSVAALLPPSSNAAYAGARSAVVFLGLCAVFTIGPGLIHSLLPDGGAVTIAGLDLGDRRETIIGLFAWAGATQIVHGLAMLAVTLRYRTLTPLFLLLVLLERGLLVAQWWVLKGAGGHHPPEHYASLAMLPLLIVFLLLSLRAQPSSSARQAASPTMSRTDARAPGSSAA